MHKLVLQDVSYTGGGYKGLYASLFPLQLFIQAQTARRVLFLFLPDS